jgi:predicted nucleotidyltransferase
MLLFDLERGGCLSQVIDVAKDVREKRDDILRIAMGHGATRVRIFGSVLHGTATADSDLDLLIDLEPGCSLLDLVAIKQDLEDLLGREVHVVTEDAISPYVRDRILHDAKPL